MTILLLLLVLAVIGIWTIVGLGYLLLRQVVEYSIAANGAVEGNAQKLDHIADRIQALIIAYPEYIRAQAEELARSANSSVTVPVSVPVPLPNDQWLHAIDNSVAAYKAAEQAFDRAFHHIENTTNRLNRLVDDIDNLTKHNTAAALSVPPAHDLATPTSHAPPMPAAPPQSGRRNQNICEVLAMADQPHQFDQSDQSDQSAQPDQRWLHNSWVLRGSPAFQRAYDTPGLAIRLPNGQIEEGVQ